MEINKKMEILDIYLSETCCCGKNKLVKRWVCIECKEKVKNVFYFKWLYFTCSLHMAAANLLIKKVYKLNYNKQHGKNN